MAEVSSRRIGELVRGVFKVLLAEPQGLPAREVLARLAAAVPPTESEERPYASLPTQRRYEKIVRFSTVMSVKAGWLVKDKGQWSLSDEGRKAYEKYKDPEAFTKAARKLYQEWLADQPDKEPVGPPDDEKELEHSTTLEEAEETAWAEIDAHLKKMDPFDFQRLVAGLLQGMGYHISWVAPPGHKGVDIIAHADPLGANGPRIKAEVKRMEDRVDLSAIEAFLNRIEDGDVGVFVAKGGFTTDAEVKARESRKRLMLLNGKRLFDLWVEHYKAIPEERKRLLPLKPVHYLLAEE